jgi:uncharacterized membrane protein YebE (DUF533 family)
MFDAKSLLDAILGGQTVAGKSELGTQIVAVATLVANPAIPKEQEFLSSLGAALGISEDLLSHIRAAVSSLRPN